MEASEEIQKRETEREGERPSREPARNPNKHTEYLVDFCIRGYGVPGPSLELSIHGRDI